MIMKGRSPTMRHVSRTHRVALDWLLDRINLEPKIQIKYIDTKCQLADILTKGSFTSDEWNHLLNLFSISHFGSTACSAATAQRACQESGEERVTAKSRPMMNLTECLRSCRFNFIKTGEDMVQILKDMFLTIERDNLWKRQDQIIYKRIMVDLGLLKSGKVELENAIDREPEKNSWDSLQDVDPHREEYLLDRIAHSARYEETILDRTGQPVSENIQGKPDFENFIMGSEITEFVNKVRDQVQIRQKRMSSIAENCTEHSIIWECL